MAPPTPPAPQSRIAPLQKQKGEKPEHHRAILLYVMQDPGGKGRSLRAVARALSRSDGSIRAWRNRFKWEERIAALQGDAAHDAAHLYRTLYFGKHGVTEIAAVEHNLPRPFPTASDAIPEAVAEPAQQEQMRRLQAEEKKGAAARAAAKARDEQIRDRLFKLIEAYTGYFAQQMKEKKIRPRLADLEIIDRLLDRLESIRQPVQIEKPAEPGRSAPVETARMRIARESGGDLLDALHDDAAEVLLILATLRDNRAAQRRRTEAEALPAASGG